MSCLNEEYIEVWDVTPPPAGVKFVILDDEWDDKAHPPVHYIRQIRVRSDS